MEINFHLPGLRQNYPLNMLLLGLMEKKPEYFREGIRIASFYGEFPMSLWNGGRPSGQDQCDGAYIREVVRNINSKGIAVRYTWTNMLLNEEDLKDPYCNFCMKVADNGMNEVMIFSPILEKYIRENYPSYKLNSSTCKRIRDIDQVNQELEKDYYMVVLDYNFNSKFEELEKIQDKARCEILVNTGCNPDCPRRGKHYENIAKNQRIMLKNRKMPPDRQIPLEPWYCRYGDDSDFHEIQSFRTYIKADELWEKYVSMGFKNFKVEGRTADLFWLLETYCYYLVKPEYQGQARILLLDNLVANRVIMLNRLKPQKWIPEE